MGTKGPARAAPARGTRVVATNRRARHDFEILETLEAGIALVGSEVKSLRAGHVQLKDSYARADGGELWLVGVHVAPYGAADAFGTHDPERRRKLLLHRHEIDKLAGRAAQESLTLIPLSIYFRDGRVKVELGLGRGRRTYDKRAAIAERDANLEARRALSRRARGKE